MSTKIVVSVLVCVLATIVQSAPQFNQQYQQQEPQQQSKFAVLDGSFHQDPNLEYNFELVKYYGYKLWWKALGIFQCIQFNFSLLDRDLWMGKSLEKMENSKQWLVWMLS